MGVCTGHKHGDGWLVVVDIDHQDRLTPEIVRALAEHPTYTVRSGGGGTHAYYLCRFEPSPDAKFPDPRPDLKAGEIKGLGGQVVAPNSLHWTGATYDTVRDLPFAPLPPVFYEYVKPYNTPAAKAESSCEKTRTLTREDLLFHARQLRFDHPQYKTFLALAQGQRISGKGSRHTEIEVELTKALVGEFGPEITDESVWALVAPSYPDPVPAKSFSDFLKGLEGARKLKLAERAACPVPAAPAQVDRVTPLDLAGASRKLLKRADAWRKDILRSLSNQQIPVDQTEAARAVLLSIPASDQALRELLPQADLAAARAQVAEVASKAEAAVKAAASKAEAKARAEERKHKRVESTVAALHEQGLDLELDEDGNVEASPLNVKRLLDATISGYRNRRTRELRVLTPWSGEVDALDATGTTITAAAWYQQKFGIKIPYQVIERMLTEAARGQERDLVQEREHVWDGVSRLSKAGDMLKRGREDTYARAWFASLLLGVAERVLHPGCPMDRWWVLKGGQGSGKTSIFDEISRLLTDQKCWRVVSGKDDDWRKRQMGVIALDDEMSAHSSVIDGEYKGWTSQDSSLIRAPYARAAERTMCGFIYAATSNHGQMLHDPTGARRFVVLELEGDDRHEAERYDQPALFAVLPQLLAEAFAIVRECGTGCAERMLATAKQEVQASQDQAQYVSEEAAALAEAFAGPDDIAAARLQVPKGLPVNTPLTNAHLDAFFGLQGTRTRAQSKAIRDAMLLLGWTFKQTWINGKPAWRWVCKNRP